MNSEERVSKFLSEPIRVEDFHTALINLLDEHAEEARAEQREACARKSKKVIDEYFRTSGHNKMMQGRIENACLNAVEKKDE